MNGELLLAQWPRTGADKPPATCGSADPESCYGGKDGSNLWMAVIREHLAAKGLGLHNDLQNESFDRR
jgi:hypothetical protein